MIICVSGLSGCGKNTVGEFISSRLNLRHIKFSFKDEAKRRGIPLMELQKMATQDPSIDKEFDANLVREAEKGGCVVTTWLGPWLVKGADIRVWLWADEKVRAERVGKRDKMPPEAALQHVRARDSNNRLRYKKYYNIDLDNQAGFDLAINSGRFSPETIGGIIVKAAESKR